MYMYVVYIYIYIYIYTYTYICNLSLSMHIYIYIHMCVSSRGFSRASSSLQSSVGIQQMFLFLEKAKAPRYSSEDACKLCAERQSCNQVHTMEVADWPREATPKALHQKGAPKRARNAARKCVPWYMGRSHEQKREKSVVDVGGHVIRAFGLGFETSLCAHHCRL